jgi:hypothetical protein
LLADARREQPAFEAPGVAQQQRVAERPGLPRPAQPDQAVDAANFGLDLRVCSIVQKL